MMAVQLYLKVPINQLQLVLPAAISYYDDLLYVEWKFLERTNQRNEII